MNGGGCGWWIVCAHKLIVKVWVWFFCVSVTVAKEYPTVHIAANDEIHFILTASECSPGIHPLTLPQIWSRERDRYYGGREEKKTKMCPLECILVVKRVKWDAGIVTPPSSPSQPIFSSFILFEYMAHSSQVLLSPSRRALLFPITRSPCAAHQASSWFCTQ